LPAHSATREAAQVIRDSPGLFQDDAVGQESGIDIAGDAGGGQRGQLAGHEPCNSLVAQRLLPDFRFFSSAGFMAGAVPLCTERHVTI
jgi:hypothetical protein